MTAALIKLAQRVGAVALLIVSVVLAYLGIVDPLWTHVRGVQDEIAQKRELLGRLSTIAALEPQMAELEQRAREAQQSPVFLAGASEALMTANLQSRISGMATGHGVRIRTTRALASKERDGLRLVGVQIHFSAPIAQLQRVLHDIESAQPVMIVESFHLQADLGGTGGRDTDTEDLIEARIDVFAATTGKKG